MKVLFRYSLVILLLVQFGSNALAQETQIDTSNLLLEKQQKQRKALQNKSDSIHKADSIENALLAKKISSLKDLDDLERKKLQDQMDSIRNVQEKRQKKIASEVDSLRKNTEGVPLVLFGDTVFYIYAKLGPFGPQDRADNINTKINQLVDKGLYDEKLVRIVEGAESIDIMHGDMIIFSVTDRDAFWAKKTREILAVKHEHAIKECIRNYEERSGFWQSIKRICLLFLVVAIILIAIRYMNKLFTFMNVNAIKLLDKHLVGISFKNYQFLSRKRQLLMLRWVLKAGKWFVILLFIYLSLPVIFSIFPATEGIASRLFGYILNPLKAFIIGFIRYIPELITIAVIATISNYIVGFLKFVASEIESGKLQINGFYSDWALPTFSLLRILIYAFAFIIIFPYLPGSSSPVFQGVSVFLGLLISLGSSSAISNIIAGLVITYMRAFNIGDRVKIGETVGDVLEKTMLVTRVRTNKNEDVTIPNASVLNGSTINYSSYAETLGLILNSTVTIGYDVPWDKVHELLIEAALNTENVLKDPAPFVLQTSLDDNYVSYQINAYTRETHSIASTYSDLHKEIQIQFNNAGIEILSPQYRVIREETQTKS